MVSPLIFVFARYICCVLRCYQPLSSCCYQPYVATNLMLLPTLCCYQPYVATNLMLLPTLCCYQPFVATNLMLLPTLCCYQPYVASNLVATNLMLLPTLCCFQPYVATNLMLLPTVNVVLPTLRWLLTVYEKEVRLADKRRASDSTNIWTFRKQYEKENEEVRIRIVNKVLPEEDESGFALIWNSLLFGFSWQTENMNSHHIIIIQITSY